MPNNKVSYEEILAAIKKKEFILLPDGRTTICMMTLDNGFTVRGESSCVDKKNYDKDEGEGIAYENAIDKCWPLLGFRLADLLHQAKLRRGRGMRYRDIRSGTYVTKAYAKLNPDTTVGER